LGRENSLLEVSERLGGEVERVLGKKRGWEERGTYRIGGLLSKYII
jgi:hypothetical protein